ncbi:MAG: HipA N-terminal domain-containing protein [Prevotellaceae bacterium]|jgi:serine/threonine-protein kinase HipA|nr:HipA N-terminal domain-containing protein [Prevotellaceae bacterium]
MRAAQIYRNGILAGVLIEESRKSYVFRYEDSYFIDSKQPAVSLTLPKTAQEYHSRFLFPFFSNMLSEGSNRRLQSLLLKIDENDDFGLLLETAQIDTVGAVTVKKIDNKYEL